MTAGATDDRKAQLERVAAIVLNASSIERPVIPARESAPNKATSGRRQAAGPIEPSPAVDSSQNPLPAPSAAEDEAISKPSPDHVADPDIPDDHSTFSASAPRNPGDGQDELEATLAECAELDHSDTDNGKRLIAYFGKDLLVRAESEVAGGSFLVWSDTHWDIDGGAAGATMKAQLVGPLIKREAEYLKAAPAEIALIDAGDVARAELKRDALIAEERQIELEEAIAAAKKARAALSKRKADRRSKGVGAKNNARIEAMKTCAAPHLRRPIDAFNADPLLVATKTHTLRFIKKLDPECPDPAVERVTGAKVEALRGHDRAHLLTSVVPVAYDAKAKPKKWLAFLERFLPIAETRRTVQQFTGLGMTGLPVQRFMLHHGTGANGKSVFLEVITRLLGPSLAIGLPVESIMGNAQKSGSQAQPDIARLFGKRMVRVVELPAGVPLSIDVVKKLTGGEMIPVRTLFKGFFEFQPVAKPHFSTNGQPTIDDASNGIWRRMFPVEWPVTLAESEQRDFEEVVRELLAEGPGILNWLIEGVLDFLVNGFVVSEGIREGTQAYRDDMDPTGPFVRDCVRAAPGQEVQATPMYHAYVAWSVEAGRKPVTLTKFGLLMKHKVRRDDTKRRHRYVDCELHDVPELTPEMREKLGLGKQRSEGQPPEPPPAGIDGLSW